jgi:nicotinate-nucleotide adenylyltransferase
MKILVFGGAFNPPTLAHETIIRACLAMPGFDQVWIMPSGERLDKAIAASDADRLKMLEIVKAQVFDGDPRLVVSDFELKLPRPTQTARTVQALEDEYPNAEFWFAFGADAYRDMPNWENGRKLMNTIKVVLFARSTADHIEGIDFIDINLPNISATKVRQAIKTGKSPNDLVSEGVARYIESRGLYQN